MLEGVVAVSRVEHLDSRHSFLLQSGLWRSWEVQPNEMLEVQRMALVDDLKRKVLEEVNGLEGHCRYLEGWRGHIGP